MTSLSRRRLLSATSLGALTGLIAACGSGTGAQKASADAASGLVIAWVGPGWVFLVNALTFLCPALALVAMRAGELYDVPRAARARGPTRASTP